MAYKKIINNVPSLSSLLLAGVVLGGGSCGKGDKDNADGSQAAAASIVLPEGTAEPSGRSSAAPQIARQDRPKGFNEAAWDIAEILFNSLNLSYMKHEPETIEESAIQKKMGNGLDVQASLKGFVNSFSESSYGPGEYPYPRALKGDFETISNFEFKTGNSQGVKNKFAHGLAFKLIADYFKESSKFMRKFEEVVKKGRALSEVGNLLNELDTFSTKYEFQPTQEFHISKQSKLLEGSKMVAFLNGSSQLLGGEIGPIFIKLKNQTPSAGSQAVASGSQTVASGSQTVASGDGTKDIKSGNEFSGFDLRKRGYGIIQDSLYVGKSDCKMPPINRLRNDYPLHRMIYNPSSPLRQFAESHPSTNPHIQEALIKQKVNFGTILFTLFNGLDSRDFISMCEGQGKDKNGGHAIQLNVKHEKFEEWCKKVDDGQEAFAQHLGEYIETTPSLQELIPVIDWGEYCKQLMTGVGSTSGTAVTQAVMEAVMKERQESGNTPSPNIDEFKHLSENDFVYRLMKTVVELARDSGKVAGLLTGNVDEVRDSIAALSAGWSQIASADSSLIYRMDINFEHRISAKIANALMDPTSAVGVAARNGQAGSARALLDEINTSIAQEAMASLASKKDGKYEATRAANEIRICIRDFRDALATKHGDKTITYRDIETETGGKFSITRVHDVARRNLESFTRVVKFDLEPFLMGVGTGFDKEAFKTFPGLSQKNQSNLAKIKADFKGKQSPESSTTVVAAGA